MAESLEILQVVWGQIITRRELWHVLHVSIGKLSHAVHVIDWELVEVLHVGTEWLLTIFTLATWAEG